MKRHWRSILLLAAVLGTGTTLATWKLASIEASDAGLASQIEPAEAIAVAVAKPIQHRQTTTSIGTVIALRSITLRNELSGTVRYVGLVPGAIVEAGKVLVELDVSVEEAELKALRAQSALTETLLTRTERANRNGAIAESEVDRARSERDVALAQIARTQAIIERKTMRAPFRARVGISDVHPGQYLEEGTLLTTLQGIDEAAHVDFSVAQQVASGLKVGETVEVFTAETAAPLQARIVAIDARIDPATRNAVVRARIDHQSAPAPGASVRVRVPVGELLETVSVPVSALRKGPEGDHVFVITPDKDGQTRAYERRVESGPVVGEGIIVQEGLEPGEQVAASGSFKLREGALVAIAEDPAPTAGGSH
jgi:membrane fusion protein (multidrug efflux system)